jgi:beta-glucosidase
VWGAATSSYQIEGAVTEGGRGTSIWDTFCRRPGAVHGGDRGDVACDHYHQYASDVTMMADLGLAAYRFSVAWPRIQPTGTGPANPTGLDFYDRLVDALLEHGIAPYLTLYHWDLPQALSDAGGWPVRATAERFAEYTAIVAGRLGDRVRHWATLNEPWCSAFLGYASGVHAPGVRNQAASLAAAHHLMLAHGLGLQVLRSALPAGAEIMLSLNVHQIDPATDDPADVAATHRLDGVANRFFLQPLASGSYPEDVIAMTAHLTDWSFVRDGDLAGIAAPLDALGLNYYTPASVTGRPVADHERDPAERVTGGTEPYPGCEDLELVARPGQRTDMGWLIDPDGLTRLLVRTAADLPGVPLMVTENGASDPTGVVDGTVDDLLRTSYLDRHLRAAHAAIRRGVDLRAYFAWSLLDNFEWAWGYSKRFGLVHVDYDTGRRTPKRSAYWLREVIRANTVPEGFLDRPVAGAPDEPDGGLPGRPALD